MVFFFELGNCLTISMIFFSMLLLSFIPSFRNADLCAQAIITSRNLPKNIIKYLKHSSNIAWQPTIHVHLGENIIKKLPYQQNLQISEASKISNYFRTLATEIRVCKGDNLKVKSPYHRCHEMNGKLLSFLALEILHYHMAM